MKNLILIISLGLIAILYFKNIRLNQINNQLAQQISSNNKTKNLSNDVSIENKAKCQKDGQIFINNKVLYYKSISDTTYQVNIDQSSYEFLYSSKFNSCLVSYEETRFENNEQIWSDHITDIYSNKDVDLCGYTWKDGKTYNFVNTHDEYQQMLLSLGFKDWIQCTLNTSTLKSK